jgi:hypothetical protein
MVSSSQIKQQLAKFLDGQISFEAFEDWFAQNTWNVHLSGSAAAEELTFAVEESLSEFSSRHINENELRDELGGLIQRENKVMVFSNVLKPVWKASSASAIFMSARR